MATRRTFLHRSAATAAALAVTTPASAQTAPKQSAPALLARTTSPTPDEALKMLMEGNARFVAGRAGNACRTPQDFSRVAAGQAPFAVIVGCADSRAGPETLFDQGVGDLFVVRIAGNVVDGAGNTVKGSIEYAVAELKSPLIMVLGHSECGAVKAAISHIDKKDSLPGAINGLVELIKPAVASVKGEPGKDLVNAIRANAKIGAAKLAGLDPIVAPAIKAGKLKVVAAVYDLATGKVELIG
jgi:carbonic anhydrase